MRTIVKLVRELPVGTVIQKTKKNWVLWHRDAPTVKLRNPEFKTAIENWLARNENKKTKL